jgi:hypothetical protein
MQAYVLAFCSTERDQARRPGARVVALRQWRMLLKELYDWQLTVDIAAYELDFSLNQCRGDVGNHAACRQPCYAVG